MSVDTVHPNIQIARTLERACRTLEKIEILLTQLTKPPMVYDGDKIVPARRTDIKPGEFTYIK